MNKKKVPLLLGLGAVCICLLLAFLLVLLEAKAPEATITDYPTALWYLLTTLTTVGYGDAYPVTVAGRVIGAIFQLMSLGLLVFLLSLLLTALRGKLIPLLKLRLAGKRSWYVFSSSTAEALSLAENLKKEQPEAFILFAGQSEEGTQLPGLPVSYSEAALVSRHQKGETSVFCCGKDSSENEALAASLQSLPCKVYCMTEHGPAQLSASVTRFDPDSCLARLYWQEHPLTDPYGKIVLIGRGSSAEALLLQALLQNVIEPKSRVRYDIFGDFGDFRRNHPVLLGEGDIRLHDDSGDALHFHDEPWNSDPGLLGEAGRIILCFPSERETADRAAKLLRHFPLQGEVHARLTVPIEGVTCFGSDSEIFTPELVMRTGLDRTAWNLNEIYRNNTGAGKPWEELSMFTRESNLASADHLRVKIRRLLGDEADGSLSREQCRKAYEIFENASPAIREECRRIEHTRWLRFHLLNNWRYAPVRDNEKRQHPLILPFDELSLEDQAKDDYAWELLRDLAQ